MTAPEPTPADEMRQAAAALRAPLPAFIAMTPRVVMSDSETMSDLAWCEDHTGWEGGPAPERPDEVACWNCDTAELMHDGLAETVRRLLAARDSLADLLDADVDTAEQVGVPVSSPALVLARAINATREDH